MNKESVNNVNSSVKMDNPVAIILKDKISKGKKYRFVNINPGFNKKFGHIGHHQNQNLLLKKKVSEDGGDFFVLCGKDLSHDDKFRNVPAFSYTPWKLLKEGDSEEFYLVFKNELQYIIELINHEDDSTKNIFFMYMADIRLIPIFLEVAKKTNPTNFFFLNLFHTYNDFYPNGRAAENINEELLAILKTTRKIRNRLGVFLFVEDEILQNRIYKYTRERLCLLPKFTSAFTDNEFDTGDERQLIYRKKRKLTFFYPTVTKERGLEFFVQMVLFLVNKGKISPFRFIIRNPHPEDNFNRSFLKEVEQFVELKMGALSDEEYKSLFKEADVIFLPYKREEFYVKSSGIFADAIIAQKPVMTTKETWLGRNTEKYKNGVTFSYGDLTSFWHALLHIKDNYKMYVGNSISVKYQWLKDNSIDVFLKMLLRLTSDEKTIAREEIAAIDSSIIDMLRILQQKNSVIISGDKNLKLIEKLKQEISQKNLLSEQKNKAIEKLKQGISQKNLLSEQKNETIEKLKQGISQKNLLSEQKNKAIEKLKQQILERDLLLKEMELTINTLKKESTEKSDTINKLNTRIKDLDFKLSLYQDSRVIRTLKKLNLLKIEERK
jgi:hypothetical protein